MNIKNCPVCNNSIPDYRMDDPYCDCGWQFQQVSSDFDEIGIFAIMVTIVGVCVLELFILLLTHFISMFSLSIIENIAIDYISIDYIVAFHFIATVSFDILLLSILFCGVSYYLGIKNSHPILVASILGIMAVGFKFLVIDPNSHIGFTPLSIIVSIILLVTTILSGIVTDYIKKQRLKRLKSSSKMS